MYTIAPTAITDPHLAALIARLDAYQESLYPAESNHLVDLSQLAVESVIVLLIRDAHQQAVGCGAIVLGRDGVGEMKRVFIDRIIVGKSLANGCWRRWKRKRCAGTAIPCGWRREFISRRRSGCIPAGVIRPAAPSPPINRTR